ncbi:tyrosinase family oxidase copper chaperone [Streptomyces sp. NPDC056160]|uniref:tyrosinase family oxidase copper chaperone n=1 Tax=Streptomyces sp. NPDC056160 TaxID=3345731 RepID=UPI0035D89983
MGFGYGSDSGRDSGDAGGTEGAGSTEGAGGETRRETTRRLLACAAAVAMAPVVGASRPPHPAADPHSGPWSGPVGTAFEETYRGRRIRGVWTPQRGAGGTGLWYVTVDGRPLHLMRRADGTWLSMVDHYGSYRTPLEAARGAVDEMGPGRRLRDLAPGPVGGPYEGSSDGSSDGSSGGPDEGPFDGSFTRGAHGGGVHA